MVATAAAIAVVGRTAGEFSSSAANSGNTFSAAATFAPVSFASATLVKAAATSATYSATVLADAPAAYWRLGEASNVTTMSDSSGNGRHGTWQDPDAKGHESAVGDADRGARWGTSDFYSTVPTAAALDLNGPFSVELWLKVAPLYPESGPRILLHKQGGPYSEGWRLSYLSTGTLELMKTDSAGTHTTFRSVPGVASTGAYRHLAVTYDGSAVRWFVDGAPDTVTAVAFPATSNPGVVRLGNVGGMPGGGGEFQYLDEVAVYGSALSATRVHAHATVGRMLHADPCARYHVYANVTDQATPPAGVTSVTADVSSVTPGAAATPLAPGSWTVGGTVYGYRSAPLQAAVAPATYAYSVTSLDGAGSHTQTGLSTAVQPPTPIAAHWLTGHESRAGNSLQPGAFTSIVGTYGTSQSPHSGTYAWTVGKNPNASTYFARDGFTATTALTFAVRLSPLPAADVTSVFAVNGSSTPLYLGYQAATQRWTLRWGSDTAVVGAGTIAANTWYTIDLRVDTTANPNTAAWRVDGVDQSSVSLAAAAQTVTNVHFGSTVAADSYSASYDDAVHSRLLVDYPIGPVRILATRPDGMGVHNTPASFQHEDGSAISTTTYLRLDDGDMASTADSVRQVSSSDTSYLELTMGDTSQVCVRGVQATAALSKPAAQGNDMKTSIFSGTTEHVVWDGDAPGNIANGYKTAVVPPVGGAWTTASLNALVSRIGYSTDINPTPIWSSVLLEYVTSG